MCGIAGRFSWNAPPDARTLGLMSASLAHRGPDAEGVHVDGCIGLAHRRLSIIDTCAGANQPMRDSDGTCRITYNGEVYNYRELRQELQQLGARFKTNSDTEVVLEAYKAWGTRCLERFIGMFAFALYDEKEQTLFLARDRLGKKPLYYADAPGGGIIFASEIKALVLDPDVPRSLSPEALGQILSLGYTLTETPMLSGVKRLAPGHYLTLKREGAPQVTPYWDLAAHFRNKSQFSSEDEAAEALLELLTDAVRLRLVSDVPLGAFLSGGLDSSAVVATMCALRPPSQNTTFSIGFLEKGYSELDEARLVADWLGVDHREKVVTPVTAEELSRIFWFADEPFADTSMIPSTLLASFAREKVTVCLSGDGSDEILGGYETYAADRIKRWTSFIPGFASSWAISCIDSCWPASRGKVSLDYKLRKFLEGHPKSQDNAHYHWRTLFSEEEKSALLNPDLSRLVGETDPCDRFADFTGHVQGCHYLDRAMYVDVKTWLADDILVKVDRAAMAHSLESRSPFLDHRLVEFAASLPVSLKMKGLKKKYLLKKAFKPRLPKSPVSRKKAGFNAPMAHWFGSPETDILGGISDEELAGDLFVPSEIHKLRAGHYQRERDNSFKIQAIAALYFWGRHFSPSLP